MQNVFRRQDWKNSCVFGNRYTILCNALTSARINVLFNNENIHPAEHQWTMIVPWDEFNFYNFHKTYWDLNEFSFTFIGHTVCSNKDAVDMYKVHECVLRVLENWTARTYDVHKSCNWLIDTNIHVFGVSMVENY